MRHLLPLPILLLCSTPLPAQTPPAPIPIPSYVDPALKLELIASEPAIVTPTGIAVDKAGHLYVIENHTHQVKKDYPGHPHDRIKLFKDTNSDGLPDTHTVFADGFRHAMTLHCDPAGVLHLVQRDKVLRLEDHNNDGLCDKQTELLRWESTGNYPHNGLGGLTFAPDGWLYIGSGENFGHSYTTVGTDGTRLPYTPGGANVFRIRPDGTRLQTVATGLWNGFGVESDGVGRIFAVDNDPDSSPPNRLLHIVPGGDYGYNLTYGRSGIHPFQCWHGELPGTLGMAAGTGEAATDLLDMRRTAWRRPGLHLMVTAWGDNQIESYEMEPHGSTVRQKERRILVRGAAAFRPACMSPAPDGSVYFTDWADRDYSVHGKGRLWKLSAQTPSPTTPAEATLPLPTTTPAPHDPWAASIAVFESQQSKGRFTTAQQARTGLTHRDPWHRAFSVATMRHLGLPLTESELTTLLTDTDPDVARIAIISATEQRLSSLKNTVWQTLSKHSGHREIFRSVMASMELIEKTTAAQPASTTDALLRPLIASSTEPESTRALAMLHLHDKTAALSELLSAFQSPTATVSAAAARALASVQKPEAWTALETLALDAMAPLEARIDACASLTSRPAESLLALTRLLESPPSLARQAVRTLRSGLALPDIRQAMEKMATQSTDESVRLMITLALGHPSKETPPLDEAAWLNALAESPGDAAEGRRVFFSTASQCANCHIAEGRGVQLGPDLTTIARSSDTRRLLQSILEPSREIGPLYSMKTATLKDGRTISGVQSLKETGGRVDLIQPGGAVLIAPRHEVSHIDVSPVSLMPPLLLHALTLQETRDLLAYLTHLK